MTLRVNALSVFKYKYYKEKQMKVLIDYSSLAWASLFAGKDPDLLTNSEGETSNTAQWAENNLTNSLLATFERFEITPRDCIFVRDGINGSKFRKNIDSS